MGRILKHGKQPKQRFVFQWCKYKKIKDCDYIKLHADIACFYNRKISVEYHSFLKSSCLKICLLQKNPPLQILWIRESSLAKVSHHIPIINHG